MNFKILSASDTDVIVETKYGHHIEHIERNTADGWPPRDWPEDTHQFEKNCFVYRKDLYGDLLKDTDWAELKDVAESNDTTVAELKRMARGSTGERADFIDSVAGHYGWEEFDSYPLQMTRREVDKRFGWDATPKRSFARIDRLAKDNHSSHSVRALTPARREAAEAISFFLKK